MQVNFAANAERNSIFHVIPKNPSPYLSILLNSGSQPFGGLVCRYRLRSSPFIPSPHLDGSLFFFFSIALSPSAVSQGTQGIYIGHEQLFLSVGHVTFPQFGLQSSHRSITDGANQAERIPDKVH